MGSGGVSKKTTGGQECPPSFSIPLNSSGLHLLGDMLRSSSSVIENQFQSLLIHQVFIFRHVSLRKDAYNRKAPFQSLLIHQVFIFIIMEQTLDDVIGFNKHKGKTVSIPLNSSGLHLLEKATGNSVLVNPYDVSIPLNSSGLHLHVVAYA